MPLHINLSPEECLAWLLLCLLCIIPVSATSSLKVKYWSTQTLRAWKPRPLGAQRSTNKLFTIAPQDTSEATTFFLDMSTFCLSGDCVTTLSILQTKYIMKLWKGKGFKRYRYWQHICIFLCSGISKPAPWSTQAPIQMSPEISIE